MFNKYFLLSLITPLFVMAQGIETKEKSVLQRPEARFDYSNISIQLPEDESLQKVISAPRWDQSAMKSFQPIAALPHYSGLNVWAADSTKASQILKGRMTFDIQESTSPQESALQEVIKQLPFLTEDMEFQEDRLQQEGDRYHYIAQQTYNGIPLHGAYLSIHFTERYIYFVNDETVDWEGDLPADFKYSDSEAIAQAYSSMDLSKQAFMPENLIEKDHADLMYVKNKEDQWVLAYELVLHPRLDQTIHVFMDAQNGSIIDQYESICKLHSHPMPNGPIQSTATDLSGASRTLNLYEQNGVYYMIDASRSMYNASASTIPSDPKGAIVTLDANNRAPQQPNFTAEIINQNNNNWNGNPKAVSAHYNSGRAYQYFLETFNRNAIDGQGGTMISLINVADENGGGLDNAFWNGKAMFYGNGNVAFTPLAEALDVAGHEMSHGVIQNTANLEYRNEPGAINESYADIFGAMIDRDDWQLAEDIVVRQYFPSGAMRDMANPNQGGSSLSDPGWQPAHYDERYTGTQNNGGVHINSGIGNRAFYLVATQIGKDKAEQIYYHTLVNYLNRRSDFLDLRASLEQSAEDLYGSQEVQAIQQAFNQVGVIPESGGEPDPGSNNGFPILEENPGQDLVLITQSFPRQMSLFDGDAELQVNGIIPESSLSKPSVTDDGGLIVFVDQNRTISYITIDWQGGTYSNVQTFNITDGNGQLIRWANAAISKNGRLLALVPNDEVPLLILFDIETGNSKSFDLYNPTYSQSQTNTNSVVGADALEFDHAGETIVYDAFNRLEGSSGFNEEYWDINIIDVWSNSSQQFTDGNIIPIFAALPDNVSIGNPSYAKNATGVIAFDYIESGSVSETYALLALDLSKSQTSTVYVNDRLSYPSYSKKDDAIIFNGANQNGDDVVGIVPMAADRIQPSANPFIFQNGYWGLWFSNGTRALVSSSLNPERQSTLRLSPNPATDLLQLEGLPIQGDYELILYSADGVVPSNWSVDPSNRQLDVSRLNPGMYFLRVQSDNGTETLNFMKQ